MRAQPSWSNLVYRLAQQARTEPEAGRLLLSLPKVLSQGASTLEVARRTSVKPERVDTLLRDLNSHRVVEAQSSGASVPFAGTLYYLGPEAQPFFSQFEALMSSDSASGAPAF